MFKFLYEIKGNARACLFTEPLWGIPFNLYAPFMTLYMFHLGVLDAQIGIIMAVGRLFQMATSIIGGIVTDKFGRRLTTFVSDLIAWSIPTLIWTFSQNFWWFLAAAIIGSTWMISAVSWECLLVEDEDESKIGTVFNWVYISGLLAVFFAPIAGVFVGVFGVVPVVRIIFFFAFITMTAKFIILFVYSTETEMGKKRIATTKKLPLIETLVGYREVLVQIKNSKTMLVALTLQTVVQVKLLVTTTFFALYATIDLNIPEAFMGYFPILRAFVMLAFLLFIQEKLNVFKHKNIMLVGLCVYISAFVWLLIAPIGNWMWLGIYVIVEACAAALMLPRIDTMAANAMAGIERARIRAVFNMTIMAITSPFAILAGVLSDMNRQLPFMLNIALMVVLMVVVMSYRAKDTKALH